jgi:hypothetical protein
MASKFIDFVLALRANMCSRLDSEQTWLRGFDSSTIRRFDSLRIESNLNLRVPNRIRIDG